MQIFSFILRNKIIPWKKISKPENHPSLVTKISNQQQSSLKQRNTVKNIYFEKAVPKTPAVNIIYCGTYNSLSGGFLEIRLDLLGAQNWGTLKRYVHSGSNVHYGAEETRNSRRVRIFREKVQ